VNPLFADWLRPVTLDFAGIDLPARIEAADALADQAAGQNVLDFVAIAYGAPAPAKGAAALRDRFKDAEPAFPMRDNDPEMQVLAAAVLEQICRAGEVDLRVFASYAITVAEHRGLTCPLPELPAAAADAIAELAVSRRQLRTKPEVKRLVLSKELKAALDAPASTGYAADEATKALFQTLASWTQSALGTAGTQTQAVADWADRNARLAGEDSRLLWWLLSGSSSTLGEPWSSLPSRVLAVLAGRELASAAVVVPAPPQSDALLLQLFAANPRPKKPVSEAKVGVLDTPEELAFLISDLESDDGRAAVDVARHSLDQTMLVRAWNELE
jgi:hypothetical protein